jgi:hypothetical protein
MMQRNKFGRSLCAAGRQTTAGTRRSSEWQEGKGYREGPLVSLLSLTERHSQLSQPIVDLLDYNNESFGFLPSSRTGCTYPLVFPLFFQRFQRLFSLHALSLLGRIVRAPLSPPLRPTFRTSASSTMTLRPALLRLSTLSPGWRQSFITRACPLAPA